MKKWVMDGLRAQKVDQAIQAYIEGKADLRAGAIIAGVSYNRFLHEVQSRRIIILEDPAFLERLNALAEGFSNSELQDAIRDVER